MGLASIPFLVSIWTAVVSILKSLWDAAKARVLLLGVFFVKLAELIWNLIRKWGIYKFVVLTGTTALVLIAVNSAVNLIPEIQSIKQGWQALLDMCPGISWLLWDSSGPIRLVEFFRGFRSVISVYITTALILFTIRKLRFEIQVMLGMKLNGGGS